MSLILKLKLLAQGAGSIFDFVDPDIDYTYLDRKAEALSPDEALERDLEAVQGDLAKAVRAFEERNPNVVNQARAAHAGALCTAG